MSALWTRRWRAIWERDVNEGDVMTMENDVPQLEEMSVIVSVWMGERAGDARSASRSVVVVSVVMFFCGWAGM